MATSHPTPAPVAGATPGCPETPKTQIVPVTRVERDAVRRILELTLDGDAIRIDTPEHVSYGRRRRRVFEAGFSILDDLGWNAEDDRERFELRVTPAVRALLADELRETRAQAADAALDHREAQREEDGEDSLLRTFGTWDAARAETARVLNHALDELAALKAIDRRLWELDRGRS